MPETVLRGIYTTLKPNAVLGISIWGKKNGPVVVWTEACVVADPSHQLEAALAVEGFRDIETERRKLPFGCSITEELMQFWYEGGNPAPERLARAWEREGRDVAEVRRWHEKIGREKYDDARAVTVEAVLTTARK
ncbi:hypothetical protein MMC30_008831 [Trapelia coarctata]|nr:hypothetical protein [Trapelia coarctata]